MAVEIWGYKIEAEFHSTSTVNLWLIKPTDNGECVVLEMTSDDINELRRELDRAETLLTSGKP